MPPSFAMVAFVIATCALIQSAHAETRTKDPFHLFNPPLKLQSMVCLLKKTLEGIVKKRWDFLFTNIDLDERFLSGNVFILTMRTLFLLSSLVSWQIVR